MLWDGIVLIHVNLATLRKDFFGEEQCAKIAKDHLCKKSNGCGSPLIQHPQTLKVMWMINSVNILRFQPDMNWQRYSSRLSLG
jgi:hypothetical protein